MTVGVGECELALGAGSVEFFFVISADNSKPLGFAAPSV
jgi:hypothetical protein